MTDQIAMMLSTDRRRRICLVSCSKSKRDSPAQARDLYTSPIFKKSIAAASCLADRVFIVSAKHGLLAPTKIVAPYDQTFVRMDRDAIDAWIEGVREQLTLIEPFDEVIVLAGQTYVNAIRAALPSAVRVVTPLEGLGLGFRLRKLGEMARPSERAKIATALYQAFFPEDGSTRTLSAANFPTASLPSRGLYLFFDPSEPSHLVPRAPRLVRVGTHGVSAGSRSTLGSRLRTHVGPLHGAGTHRSSVFRLHVGAAYLSRDKAADDLPAWGKGSVADRVTRQTEADLEKKVSEYIRSLRIGIIPLDDESGPQSRRAMTEKALIGLFTESGILLELPSDSWLGHYSPKEEIRRSGLWNIQHIQCQSDLHIARQAIEIANGRPELPL